MKILSGLWYHRCKTFYVNQIYRWYVASHNLANKVLLGLTAAPSILLSWLFFPLDFSESESDWLPESEPLPDALLPDWLLLELLLLELEPDPDPDPDSSSELLTHKHKQVFNQKYYDLCEQITPDSKTVILQ